jgi:hypothetical protein
MRHTPWLMIDCCSVHFDTVQSDGKQQVTSASVARQAFRIELNWISFRFMPVLLMSAWIAGFELTIRSARSGSIGHHVIGAVRQRLPKTRSYTLADPNRCALCEFSARSPPYGALLLTWSAPCTRRIYISVVAKITYDATILRQQSNIGVLGIFFMLCALPLRAYTV